MAKNNKAKKQAKRLKQKLKKQAKKLAEKTCTVCMVNHCEENHCTQCKGNDKRVCRDCIINLLKNETITEDLGSRFAIVTKVNYTCPHCRKKIPPPAWVNTTRVASLKMAQLMAETLPDDHQFKPILLNDVAATKASLTRIYDFNQLIVKSNGSSGSSALYIAIQFNHFEVLKVLVNSGLFDANAEEYIEDITMSTLQYAAFLGHVKCVDILLKAPTIEVNSVDEDGSTALHAAALNKKTDCFKRLLQHPDIDMNKLNKFGKSPLDIAIENELNIVEYIVDMYC